MFAFARRSDLEEEEGCVRRFLDGVLSNQAVTPDSKREGASLIWLIFLGAFCMHILPSCLPSFPLVVPPIERDHSSESLLQELPIPSLH